MPDELTPSTNIEKFLAKTAGESVELPEPVTRIEKYLNKIASEQTITEATDNWLDEHIDPSTGYVLDSTLTMNNAAPPASAVGDLKSDLGEKINEFNTYRTIYTAPWTQGRLSETTGENTNSSTRCRTNSFTFGDMAEQIYCEVAANYKFAIFEYDANGTYTGRFVWFTESSYVKVKHNYRYRFLIAHMNNADITPQNVPEYVLAVSYYINWVNRNIQELKDTTGVKKFYSIPRSNAGMGYVSYITGEVVSSESSTHTDYIDISDFGQLYYTRQWLTVSSPAGGMAFYDSNKEYITGLSSARNNPSSASYNSVLRILNVPKNAKYARFTLFASVSSGTFELYGIPKILVDLEKAKNGILTKRNNQSLINEFIDVAKSYLNQNLTYGYNTILQTSSETNEIDCSTFVGLCLRGWKYQDTSYFTQDYVSPNSWVAFPDYKWSVNPYDYTEPTNNEFPNTTLQTYTKVRTASQLAQWMVERGCTVPKDEHLANIEPGDIIFYARRDSSTGKYVEEERYMNINHCAICISKDRATGSESWDIEKYPYEHQIIDSRTRQGSIGIENLEDGMNDPTAIYANNINTIVLICRPDLGAVKDEPFVVTLTPTNLDFSGTMDKTTAEINAAFEAGRKIVFSVPQLNGEVFNADTSIACDTTGGGRYLTAYIINTSNNILIVAWNSPDEESNAYHTAIYPLTPMS